MPKVIVLDRDPKYTSAFWMHFFKKVNTKLRFSMAFHFQTVGKMELVNEVSNQCLLRNSVSGDPRYWADYEDRADFSRNVAMYLAVPNAYVGGFGD